MRKRNWLDWLWITVLAVIVATLVWVLCGCSLLPEKRTESVKAAENIAATQSLMIEKVLGGATNSSVRLEHTASQTAAANEDSKAKVSVPLVVTVVGCSVSLVALLAAWVAFSRLSAVGKSADRALGVVEDGVSHTLSQITDPVAKLTVQSLSGMVAKQRGKLASKKS